MTSSQDLGSKILRCSAKGFERIVFIDNLGKSKVGKFDLNVIVAGHAKNVFWNPSKINIEKERHVR
jgi:homospermidine synthase